MRAISAGPGVQRLAEADQRREARSSELVDDLKKARRHFPALPGGSVALEQQLAKLLFQPVSGIDGRVLVQVQLQFLRLVGGQMAGMPAHQRHQSAFPC